MILSSLQEASDNIGANREWFHNDFPSKIYGLIN
ncbi:hypothetical protein LCGC14_1197150 [marine sediment metagenome]|uniref:Uncharacterized protein n=1 Tax=marine sediment metagenome TaxID=412755 RepID=A0A0F9PMW2_9ZZZZ